MLYSLLVTSIVLVMPGQAEGRRHSMLGGRPSPKPEAKAEAAKKPEPPREAKKPDPSPKPTPEESEASAAALAEYNGLKEKAPRTIAGHLKLAEWCDQHGLKAEARLHYSEVARLDPKRESAWRKLGYRKVGHRWMSQAQITDAEEQKKADQFWSSRLRKIHRDIHGSHGAKRRDAARSSLAAIAEPRAIPSLYREFGRNSPPDQLMLIEALARIDRPLSTKVLAMMSVYGLTPEVRRRAAEHLRGRSSEDFLELLVGLMVDPLKYEVRRVGGPGSPGVILVEGVRFNLARFYAPPAPNIPWRPGDVVGFDAYGMPSITESLGTVSSATQGVPGSKTLVRTTTTSETVTYSVGQILVEAQKAAVAAEAQLEADVRKIQAINGVRQRFNHVVMAVASYATGKDRGQTPKEWRDSIAAEKNYPREKPAYKPTVTEMAPLAYMPVITPSLSFMTTTSVHVDT